MNPTLRARHRPLAYANMVAHPALSTKHDTPTKFAATRNAYLRNQNTVFTYMHIMSNLHQIIYLRATTYHRLAHLRTVNAGIGANFHIIFYENRTHVSDLLMMVPHPPVSKTVRPYRRIGVNDHPVANCTVRINHNVRRQQALVTNRHTTSDNTPRLHNRPTTYTRILPNDYIRPNGNTLTELRRRRNHRTRRNSRWDTLRRRGKKVQQHVQRPLNIVHQNQSRLTCARKASRNDHRPCLRLGQTIRVTFVRQKRNITPARLVQRRQTIHHLLTRAFQRTAQLQSQFRQFDSVSHH